MRFVQDVFRWKNKKYHEANIPRRIFCVSITKLKNYNTDNTARKSNIKNYKENIVSLKKLQRECEILLH